MVRVLSPLFAAALAVAGATAGERGDFDVYLDVRVVTADAPPSYVYGGLGKLRFDEEHEGLRVGELGLGYERAFTSSLSLTAHATTYGQNDAYFDLTEAYLSWRQVPRSAWRSELKVGAFYAPISLENRAAGWRSPYSLTTSAINTWVGEELRTIGAEYSLDWLGQKVGRSFDVGGVVGIFAWNDPAGIVIAERGWGFHDRQTTLFGELGEHPIFREIDGRPGVYAGAEVRIHDRLELRALRYENRGDRTSYLAAIDDYAWDTSFDSLGLVWTPTASLTVMAQAMQGDTFIEPGPTVEWRFDAAFVLASYTRGRHRFTARLDTFDMQKLSGSLPFNTDTGHAAMLCYMREVSDGMTLVGEALRVDGELSGRALIGEPVRAIERSFQVGVRLGL